MMIHPAWRLGISVSIGAVLLLARKSYLVVSCSSLLFIKLFFLLQFIWWLSLSRKEKDHKKKDCVCRTIIRYDLDRDQFSAKTNKDGNP